MECMRSLELSLHISGWFFLQGFQVSQSVWMDTPQHLRQYNPRKEIFNINQQCFALTVQRVLQEPKLGLYHRMLSSYHLLV